MRSPERIDEISSLIKDIWNEDPDMRYMQLIYVLQAAYSKQNDGVGKVEDQSDAMYTKVAFDLFNVEDDDLKLFLESYLSERRMHITGSQQ